MFCLHLTWVCIWLLAFWYLVLHFLTILQLHLTQVTFIYDAKKWESRINSYVYKYFKVQLLDFFKRNYIYGSDYTELTDIIFYISSCFGGDRVC